MAPEKVTVMVLKVDLQCSKCYRKVKKLMCKFPQIRDQVFDEKSNSVTITVVCCSPERIRDKLCSKGGGSIKSIDIKEPPKPKPPTAAGGGDAPPPQPKAKEPEKPKDQPPPSKPKDAEKPKAAEKPKDAEKPKAAEKPKDAEKPKAAEKPKEGEKPKPPAEKPKDDPKPQPPQQPPAKSAQPLMAPVQAYPSPIQMYPNGVGYGHGHGVCYEGCGMGPCNHVSYGQPLLAVPCYESYGRPVYDSWGGGSVAAGGGGGVYGRNAYHVGRNDGNYFSDENQQGCIIM